MSDFPELADIGELGEAARICTDAKLRPTLKSAFDILRAAIKTFTADTTADNLRALNGAWSHAAHVYQAYRTPAPPPTPMSPPVEGALLQVAA